MTRPENPQIGWLWSERLKQQTPEERRFRAAIFIAREAVLRTLESGHGVRINRSPGPQPSPMEPKNENGFWTLMAVAPESGIRQIPSGVMPPIRRALADQNDFILTGPYLSKDFGVEQQLIDSMSEELQIVPEDFAYNYPMALWTPYNYYMNNATDEHQNYWSTPLLD